MTDGQQALAVGQIWEDIDPRGRRRFRVVDLTAGHAVVETLSSGRRSRIMRTRFRPTSTGYRLIEQAPGAPARRPLIEVLSEELTARGYRRIGPAVDGQWSHPDWDGASDRILVALADALTREAEGVG